jgi:hypothetical protein
VSGVDCWGRWRLLLMGIEMWRGMGIGGWGLYKLGVEGEFMGWAALDEVRRWMTGHTRWLRTYGGGQCV